MFIFTTVRTLHANKYVRRWRRYLNYPVFGPRILLSVLMNIWVLQSVISVRGFITTNARVSGLANFCNIYCGLGRRSVRNNVNKIRTFAARWKSKKTLAFCLLGRWWCGINEAVKSDNLQDETANSKWTIMVFHAENYVSRLAETIVRTSIHNVEVRLQYIGVFQLVVNEPLLVSGWFASYITTDGKMALNLI